MYLSQNPFIQSMYKDTYNAKGAHTQKDKFWNLLSASTALAFPSEICYFPYFNTEFKYSKGHANRITINLAGDEW